MSARTVARLRLTVLGCSTASPHPAWPASGYLIEWDQTAILLDLGQGVVRRLQRIMDPPELSAAIVSHMHADHYLDLVGLRYLFPWGEASRSPLPVHVPPGGRERMDALATAISERAGFFDMAYDISEYDPEAVLTIGPLVVRFIPGRHYVPAWGVIVEAPDGTRLAYTGDTGPDDAVVDAVRGADLLLVEAALQRAADDDEERGHLTPAEAIELATRAQVGSALLVHYPPSRLVEIEAACALAGPWIEPAVAGLVVRVEPAARHVATETDYAPRATASAAAARDR